MSGQNEEQDPGSPSASRSRPPADESDRGPERRERRWRSRLLHQVGDATSLATVGLAVASLTALWLAVGFFFAFPSWWNNVLYSVTSSITLVMVFVIQHTQARQQAATQRKLDEMVRALPAANNRLIAVEEAASDVELENLADSNLDHRKQAETETQQ
ncbi:hypothetical protein E3T33_03530 [Cryobacterium sp. TMT1-2-1]|nr:hypothetical protein E3T33_03530 [Cryobacterium sp. TMT1-2-1]TFD90600.1 hypothetical protein E3T56_01370 [Cryobacterium psychrotolerans]